MRSCRNFKTNRCYHLISRVAHRAFFFFVFAFAAWMAKADGHAKVAIELRSDRADGFYRAGETCCFEVKGVVDTNGTLAAKGVFEYQIDNFATNVFECGKVDFAQANPLRLAFEVPGSGFYRLRVKGAYKIDRFGKFVRRMRDWGIGCEPERIVMGGETPEDFDAFWNEAKAKCEKVPLDAEVNRVEARSTPDWEVYTVSFATVGREDARVYGVMSVPKGKPGEKFPLQVEVPGSGFGEYSQCIWPKKDRIILKMGVYPWVPGRGVNKLDQSVNHANLKAACVAHYAGKLGEDVKPNHLMWGIDESREKYFLYPVVLGINRAVDWALRRADVDRTRVWYKGHSQGGYFGLMLTALNGNFTRAVILSPGGADVFGCLKGRPSSHPRPYEYFSKQPEMLKRAVANGRYFDGASFASRIRCPCFFVAGLTDGVCPPSTVHAAYNELKVGEKWIVTVPGMPHSVTDEVERQADEWLSAEPTTANPLLKDWSATGGIPPFDEIRMEHVLPAYAQAIDEERDEIVAICSQSEAPDYENTVRRLTLAGAKVDRIRLLMVNCSASCLTPAVEQVAAAQAPILAARQSEIYSNAELFKRIETVYAQRERLPTERRRVTETIYRRFLHAGVRLGDVDRKRLKDIQSRLDVLSLQFISNINAEGAAFKRDFGFALLDLPVRLAGIDDRAERERIFRAAKDCCRRDNGHDNRPVALEMLKLRHERAKLLGYRNAAEMLTEHTMAKTPERALEMMMTIERQAKTKVLENREELRALMERDIAEGRLPVGSRLEPWDWDYYQQRLRASKITFSNKELKPYLPRKRVFEACFAIAREMYGITVEEVKDAPSFAPGETETYRLHDADGSFLGTLVFDYRPRPTKHVGAWIEPFVFQFRDRNGVEVRPVASQAGSLDNYFTLNNVCTVFHEFGHALHALCSRCEDATLSGLNGTHEYNEIFSQFNQEIGLDRAYLLTYARNDAGEAVPPELLDRALADRSFWAAAKNIRRIGTSILDLRLHQLVDFDLLDLEAYQQQVLKEIDWPHGVAIAYEIPMMRHVFVHGYEAGFFAYAWSRVMSEDLLDTFRRHGDLRNPHKAMRFRKVFLERGYSHDPTENFREFMGRDPEFGPYLKAVGFQ